MSEMELSLARRRPAGRQVAEAGGVLAWSLAIAIASRIAVPLPFTPVPITLQTLAVVACGALLGSRRGTAAILLYLAEGAAGLPVFSLGGAGIAHLLGPTGGYLLAFPVAALATGALADRGWTRSRSGALGALAVGTAAIYAGGLARLALACGIGQAVTLGLVPFLPGESLKLAAGCLLVATRRR
jgi:biotin transport system substrate-specific component